jgi:hypothetical protein
MHEDIVLEDTAVVLILEQCRNIRIFLKLEQVWLAKRDVFY